MHNFQLTHPVDSGLSPENFHVSSPLPLIYAMLLRTLSAVLLSSSSGRHVLSSAMRCITFHHPRIVFRNPLNDPSYLGFAQRVHSIPAVLHGTRSMRLNCLRTLILSRQTKFLVNSFPKNRSFCSEASDKYHFVNGHVRSFL